MINQWAPFISGTGYRAAFPKVPVDDNFSKLDATRVLDILIFIYKVYFPEKLDRFMEGFKKLCAMYDNDIRSAVLAREDMLWNYIHDIQTQLVKGTLKPKKAPKELRETPEEAAKARKWMLYGGAALAALILWGKA